MDGENIYALCDVDWKAAEDAFQSYPKAKRYRDYREMLDKDAKSIDAVTVSTPDHSHTAAGLLAMRAGKHTYIQKPLARTMGEVRVLAEYARTHPKLMTQMGNQGHAREGTRQIREWVEASAIGTVREVQFWTNRPIWPQAIDRPLEEYYVPATLDWNLWLGPAPERPYHPAYVPFKWRGFWDFGTGALGDMACHIMDAAYWALDLGLPTRIEPESTPLFKETAPAGSRITYTFRAKGSRPEVRVVWHDGSLYPARPPEVADDAPWPFDRGGGQLWIGTDGKLVAGTYGDDPKVLDPAKQADIVAPSPAHRPRDPVRRRTRHESDAVHLPDDPHYRGDPLRDQCRAAVARPHRQAHPRLRHRPRPVLRDPRPLRRALGLAVWDREREPLGAIRDREPAARVRACHV